jgi:cysteine desulfurase
MRRTYLDHNASTPLHPAARAALEHAFSAPLGNPSSPHAEGRRARDLLEGARERVASVLGCRGREVLFTSGGTEAANLGLVGAARARAAPGRHRVVTAVEARRRPRAASASRAKAWSPGAPGQMGVDAFTVAAACTPVRPWRP